MKMKIETWNGHAIRFVEKEPGSWWAIARDVVIALAYKNANVAMKRHCRWVSKCYLPHPQSADQKIEINIIHERDIYRLIFRSNLPEAEAFQDWVCDVLQALRQASGLEAFQVFRMLDKEHQKDAMHKLRDGLSRPVRVDFIKANTIANKAVSTNHGYPQMLKKDQMTPDMLLERQPILQDTVTLMEANDSFGLGLSISDAVYTKYCH
jgi:prophage antirepressor-like protein